MRFLFRHTIGTSYMYPLNNNERKANVSLLQVFEK